MYHVRTGRLVLLGPEMAYVVGAFDHTGREVTVCTVAIEGGGHGAVLGRTPVDRWDPRYVRTDVIFRHLPSPASDLIPLVDYVDCGKHRLLLADTRTGKVDSVLEGPESIGRALRPGIQLGHWTPDGKYFCYLYAAVEQAPKRYVVETRCWDVARKRVGRVLLDEITVGPGPGKSTVFVVRRVKGDRAQYAVRDVPTGKAWAGSMPKAIAMRARCGYFLYVDEKPGGKRILRMTKLVTVDEASATRPAQTRPAATKPATRGTATTTGTR